MRDEHHRPAGHVAWRRGDQSALACDLFTHPLKDSFGYGEFIPLGSHRGQLLGQLCFEVVQLCASHGYPFQHLGIHHAPDRRGPSGPSK